ncbi:VOC family protein, partial [Erythrobacter sp. QSSC1-22B]|uniref:VOC family protein n=1 Tax=Erythrobacter sp. QSSC1-22B TaxID=1860125 RepID=UPI0018F879DD
MAFKITSYEHVGIRVTDRARATQFYEALGWKEEIDLPEHMANEMVNESGVYINLIFNGIPRDGAKNILQDEDLKHPGMTHAAFIVDDLDALMG